MSILKKADKKSFKPAQFDGNETKFIKEIIFWEEALDNAVSNLKPNLICEYLHRISDAFNAFYEKNRIIGDEREESRLVIVNAFKDIVENLSRFLGIELVEKI